MTRSIRPVAFGLAALVAAGAVACSTRPDDTFVTAKGAALARAESCGDLLTKIQADAIAKLDQTVAQQEQYVREDTYYRGGVAEDDGGVVGIPTGDGAAAPGSGTGTGTGTGGELGGEVPAAPSAPGEYSETNTQVVGVDEADIVKTDGERIYLLHGSQFYILDAWPADQTRALGSAAVEGQGFEMFVFEGKATVYSTVYPSDLPAAPGAVGATDGGTGTGTGSIGAPVAPDCFDCYYNGPTFTKISVFDVTGAAPQLEREMIFEGNYVSARRHDSVVRTIVQGGFQASGIYYPNVEYYDTFGNMKSDDRIIEDLHDWRDDVAADIEASTLDNWIPRRFERVDGAWSALPVECESYYIPDPGLVESGVTQVVTFEVGTSNAPGVTSILGGAETVYANHDVMILGQTDYQWEFRTVEQTQTVLHQFRIAGASTNYEASGFMPGYLHNQFSLDEQGGVIRASTTQEVVIDADTWSTESANRVVTLANKDGALEVIGRTEALAPGEQIMSTRFIGDRGYVVTFRQVDPLFVVDLADPTKPAVLGELKIPGFSEYIHPLEGNFLLTIGQDADASGFQNGVALQIFDVSNPAAPALAHKHAFSGFSYSEAGNNHKAFTFVDDKFGPDRGLLMFPIVTYDPVYQASLQVLEVSAQNGFTQLGTIDHAGLLQQNCPDYELYGYYCYYGGDEMRRGLMVEDYVYAVSQGGVTVHALGALDAEVARVELPQPTYDYYYYGGVGGGGVGAPVPDAAMGGSSGQ